MGYFFTKFFVFVLFGDLYEIGQIGPLWLVNQVYKTQGMHALGEDKQRKLHFKWCVFFVYLVPSGSLTLKHGSFGPREWLAAKGLFSTQA